MLKLTEQSPKHIIETIANSRYGNPTWDQARMSLNSKGLMSEYLMMDAQENFIRQQTAIVRQRIEAVLAVIGNANLVEFGKKIQAMQVTAEAGKVPTVIDLQLEAGGDEYVDSGYWSQGGAGDGAECTPTANDGKSTSVAVKMSEAIFMGDSLAEAYRADARYAKRGRNPSQVLSYLKNAGDLKGKTVVISTGLSNNIKDIASVEKQMQYLSQSGANVVVLGIVDNFKNDIQLASKTNAFLSQQASKYGFGFQRVGNWQRGDEAYKAHPKNLTESQFVRASSNTGVSTTSCENVSHESAPYTSGAAPKGFTPDKAEVIKK
ncbi:hypothetical protein LU293_00270 [Moraxella nasovis]|uniref:hypothetical protein n=1 Tax=Moraxella nasovis TaxID=2904121 RepID=UPI001F61C160|nr:hypothetical protein [Moraxella nasovis]UNU73388.1 hypothetical protein LU293_00270 [Moraxella nasovis]